ncbi:MAG: hypothetical protein V1792_10110 [Pseudomonadota bacterium]
MAMPVDLTRKMADQTWETRRKMDELVKAGISEDEALAELMSLDPHRDTKLKVWRDRGLWPITNAERQERAACNELPDPFDPDSLICSCAGDGFRCADPETLQTDAPEAAVQDLLAAVRVTVNAAIMDYHNVQIVQLEDRIAALQGRIEQLEQGRDGASARPAGHSPEHASVGTAAGPVDRAPAVNELVRELAAPPRPRTVFGSREQVARQREITVRCDSALLDVFERDMRERGYDGDRMMDFVLYNFYDRPALSFQLAGPGK